MDLSILMPWIGAALSIIALGTQLKAIISSGERKLEERVTKVELKLVEHDRRIQTVESEMKHLPDRETAHNLQISMERIAGRLDTMDERLRPIAATNHRLQEYLLEQAKK
ncbi:MULTISPECIES: DUF2730 family protein [unclassified Shinella]|nr:MULTISPECIES: DUF2730 family protein [unclassified Shinella]CAI0339122.1 Clp protease [Rhizobiaceae bacterium]CAK7257536.1 DUF2730 family protein [Shinella sp. WSC3-e]MCO5139007.1 DUF2730 domain-containing protein [Shinella sp.]MCW5708687.1 DUF2730 family protein [Shinella sp.]MCW5712872.1 DUF2730 family protein [Shinella sp.]